MSNPKDLPKLIIELDTTANHNDGVEEEEEIGFVDVEQGGDTQTGNNHQEEEKEDSHKDEAENKGAKSQEGVEGTTLDHLAFDFTSNEATKKKIGTKKGDEDDSAQTRETEAESLCTSETDYARRIVNYSSDVSVDDEGDPAAAAALLRVGDLSVPMPMPLPTTTLQRQNGRVPRPEAIPGAIAMDGTNDPRRRSRRRVVQAPRQETPIAATEDGQIITTTTTDGHIIDEAVLVEEEEEVEEDPEQQQMQPGTDDENANNEVIEGQILQEEQIPSSASSKRWFWWMVVLVLVGLIAFLVFFFTLGRNSTTTTTTSSTAGTSNASGDELPLVLYPPFAQNLPTASIKALNIIGSPVYYANRWMLHDPNLHTYPRYRQLQRVTLAGLYYGTQGDTWLNKDGWMSYDVPECEWWSNTVVEELKGKPICDEEGYLNIIAVANNNLTGIIADMSGFNAVPHLPRVYAFDIANNNISGESPMLDSGVPVEIISISNNQFDSIAPTMGKMAFEIRYLHIDNNKFKLVGSGVLWTLFPALESLNFTGNLFDGPFYESMKTCKNLTYLGAGSNLLYGTLPSVLGELTKLEYLDVSGNPELDGVLPSELGLLTNLKQVNIRDTAIAEELPAAICESKDEEEPLGVELLANNCSSADAAAPCGCE